MPSLLPNLSNESILLMYLAGELPDEDRGEVERLLTIDVAMRAQLDELRAAYGGAEAAFVDADAGDRLALSASTASRRVGQAVRSWHARRLSEPEAGEFVPRRLRLPRWAYPVVGAAVVAIGLVSWWGFRDDTGPVVLKPLPGPRPAFDAPSFDPNVAATFVTEVEDSYAAVRDEADAVLDDAENDLYAFSIPLAEQGAFSPALTDEPTSSFSPDTTDEQ